MKLLLRSKTRTSAAPARADAALARRRRRERGAALIMVLGSLTILSVMLSEFQDEMSTEFASAMSDRDALKAEYAAQSAINLSRLLIAAEPTVRQAASFLLAALGGGKAPQIPVWEFSSQILGAFNDEMGAESFKSLGLDASQGSGLGLDGAGFDLRIVDEDSKIGLNTAGRSSFGARDVGRQLMGLIGGPQFDPLFDRRGADGDYSNRFDICSAIIDWVDANQDLESCDGNSQAQSAPAEDAYYRNLPDPYTRKNAAFDSLEELRLVRGVGDDFWATFIEPNPDEPRERPVSVWSSGKININTTSPRTLLSYVCAWAVPDTPLCNDQTGELPASFLTTMAMAQGMFGHPDLPFAQAAARGAGGQGRDGELPADRRPPADHVPLGQRFRERPVAGEQGVQHLRGRLRSPGQARDARAHHRCRRLSQGAERHRYGGARPRQQPVGRPEESIAGPKG